MHHTQDITNAYASCAYKCTLLYYTNTSTNMNVYRMFSPRKEKKRKKRVQTIRYQCERVTQPHDIAYTYIIPNALIIITNSTYYNLIQHYKHERNKTEENKNKLFIPTTLPNKYQVHEKNLPNIHQKNKGQLEIVSKQSKSYKVSHTKASARTHI